MKSIDYEPAPLISICFQSLWYALEEKVHHTLTMVEVGH